MPRRLNVIDLDKTLIRIDSFKHLILRNINLSLILFAVMRKMGIISRYDFAKKTSKKLAPVLSDRRKTDEFVHYLGSKVNNDIMNKINEVSRGDVLTVIISSSPDEYVKIFADLFGFSGFGSRWINGEYFHCYGENKVKYIKDNFPETEYTYNFSISDSKSDIELLSLFKESIFLDD